MASTTLNQLNSTHASRRHATADRAAAAHGALSELGQRIRLWRKRSRERYELMQMSDLDLSDIGISRTDVEMEAAKPFWRG